MRDASEQKSPLMISIMFAAYTGQPLDGVAGFDSQPGRSAMSWLQVYELVSKDGRATPKGVAWVRAILRTPLPVQIWVDPTDTEAVRRGLVD